METYMLLIRGDENPPASPEDMGTRMQQYQPWRKKLVEEDRYVSGAPLENSKGFQIKRKGTLHTDGPFMEAKEIVGGYILVKAADYEDAIALGQSCPLNQWHDIEVRKVKPMA